MVDELAAGTKTVNEIRKERGLPPYEPVHIYQARGEKLSCGAMGSDRHVTPFWDRVTCLECLKHQHPAWCDKEGCDWQGTLNEALACSREGFSACPKCGGIYVAKGKRPVAVQRKKRNYWEAE